MKLTSDTETLAENKVLILYILNKIGKPISNDALLNLVLSVTDMNYFYFQQFLLDLIEDNYVISLKKENDDIYELTEDGKNALDLTIDVIPGILKLRVDSKFTENFNTIKDEFSIVAEYAPVTETDFSVKCKIIENNNIVFNLEAYAGSREQAKQIVNNWKKHAIHIYPEILHTLVDEREEEI